MVHHPIRLKERLPHMGRDQITGLARVLLLGVAVFWANTLLAQSPDKPNDPVKVGDRWVYESKDEITGLPKDTFTHIVTEVSKDQIVTSVAFRGKNSSIATFGRDWSVIDNGVWKFKPSNGGGVQLPLAVGKEWRAQFEAKNLQNGANRKGSTLSKVVAQETLTTAAGTFETFKIDWQEKEYSAADPSKSAEAESVIWYAPQINRWVRRTFVLKMDKRVRTSTSEELTDFSRDF